MHDQSTRRSFMGAALGWAGLAACSPSEPAKPESGPSATSASSGPRMKLSLSVRVAEKFDNKRESSLTIEQLTRLAKDNGYGALCMRASQAGTHTDPEVVKTISKKIHDAGLAVSMVTGDFAVPQK